MLINYSLWMRCLNYINQFTHNIMQGKRGEYVIYFFCVAFFVALYPALKIPGFFVLFYILLKILKNYLEEKECQDHSTATK